MAGIYLHIPFCKKACHYCDFHFSTSPVHKDRMVEALVREIRLRRDYLSGELIQTIYLGGGTPSVLSAAELGKLIGEITDTYEVSANAEITIETNPDDLDAQKVKELRQIPVNRFSIGIQSFFDEDLAWMNRAHSGSEALSSIKRIQDAGFENITSDLIYGYPLLSDEKWLSNIRQLIDLDIPHISSYSMTVEPATALASFISKGRQKPMDENQSAAQFEILMDELGQAGFEHYEISNFSLPGMHSRHNSNYWEGVNYAGIGPSAHSFNGDTRQWNIANNSKYMSTIEAGQLPSETERLTSLNKINEYIMTALRTSKGLNRALFEQRFEFSFQEVIMNNLEPFLEKEWLTITDQHVTLTRAGKLYADHIASELFIDEPG